MPKKIISEGKVYEKEAVSKLDTASFFVKFVRIPPLQEHFQIFNSRGLLFLLRHPLI